MNFTTTRCFTCVCSYTCVYTGCSTDVHTNCQGLQDKAKGPEGHEPHGRPVRRYSKLADWAYIGACAAAAPGLQLIGNGDILSFTEYNERMAACPQLATAMLARGALVKPWLFTEARTLPGSFAGSAFHAWERRECSKTGLKWPLRQRSARELAPDWLPTIM